MENDKMISGQQPEALAELAKTSREEIPGAGVRNLNAGRETKPIPTRNATKHDVAENLLAAGAEGQEPDPKKAGEERLPDRTRVKS